MSQFKFLLAYCLTASHFRSSSAFSPPWLIPRHRAVLTALPNQVEDRHYNFASKIQIEDAVNNVGVYDEARELVWKDPEVVETIQEEFDQEQLEEDERYMREAIKVAMSV